MISEQWQKATDTPSGVGSSVDVAALGNKIYVTGGTSWDHDKKNFCFARVDCYDTVTKSWSQVANMNTSKHRHGLISLYGRLYAIGGAYQALMTLCSYDRVEVYDPDKNTWTLLQNKLEGRLNRLDDTGACLYSVRARDHLDNWEIKSFSRQEKYNQENYDQEKYNQEKYNLKEKRRCFIL